MKKRQRRRFKNLCPGTGTEPHYQRMSLSPGDQQIRCRVCQQQVRVRKYPSRQDGYAAGTLVRHNLNRKLHWWERFLYWRWRS